jgi:hypothetical protein
MRCLRALALASLFLMTAVFPAAAGEKLSGGELRSLFPGRFHAIVSGVMKFMITAKGDGSLSATSPKGKTDQGRWSVRSGKLCIEFENWLGGRVSCTPVVQEAGWYKASLVKFKRI